MNVCRYVYSVNLRLLGFYEMYAYNVGKNEYKYTDVFVIFIDDGKMTEKNT